MRTLAATVGMLFIVHGATVSGAAKPSLDDVRTILGKSGLPDSAKFVVQKEVFSPDQFVRWHWAEGERYVKEFKDKVLSSEAWSDVDSDGISEYAVILEAREGDTFRLFLMAFKRWHGRWARIHRRVSWTKNLVNAAFLEPIEGGFRVHVFEARAQCDDERPEAYDLIWQPQEGRFVAPFPGEDLHPFDRDWECGE